MHRLAIASLLCTALVGSARADVTRCSNADADVSYNATDLGELSGDTGWFPSGSPAQLRITGLVVGQTTVAMGMSATACWDQTGAMTVTLPGRPGSGLLDSEYGAALHLYGQIHTSILGISYDWSGEIPLPSFIPSNLLLAGTTSFDPAALPDSSQPLISVTSPPTSPVIVLSTDVLTAFISIVGISGGLNLSVQGEMTTAYESDSISFGNDTITSATAGAQIAKPEAGFPAAMQVTVSANGTVHYEPSLIFAVNFDVKILGIRVVNWQLASLSMPLPTIDRPVVLNAAAPSAIPLPHFDAIPTKLGFAGGSTQVLSLHNSGGMAIQIEMATGPNGVTVAPSTIPPGGDGTVTVTAADPHTVGSAPLVLNTNDPNYPTLDVMLDPATDGQTTTPTDPPKEKHGGCDVGGSSAGVLLAFALFALPRRRRARAC